MVFLIIVQCGDYEANGRQTGSASSAVSSNVYRMVGTVQKPVLFFTHWIGYYYSGMIPIPGTNT